VIIPNCISWAGWYNDNYIEVVSKLNLGHPASCDDWSLVFAWVQQSSWIVPHNRTSLKS
jgi:hypothetical protein